MQKATPGVVIVTTFTDPKENYADYLDYKNRPSATKTAYQEAVDDIFADYLDYMGNPQKAMDLPAEQLSGLFTADLDALDKDEICKLKDVYTMAGKNGSLMWEPVISFDNKWLVKVGVYDENIGYLDTNRMRNVVRAAVGRLLEQEHLQNAVWSASFHYNTDNIHAHVSIVEPQPMRESRVYKQYEVTKIDGKWQYKRILNEETGELERIPLLDENGEIIEKEEYVGEFKESSLEAAKSIIVSELTNNKEINRQINEIVRQRIVDKMNDHGLYNDPAFREAFLSLYRKLPDDKRVCNYKNNAMQPLRKEIDQLSLMYLQKYHKDDYREMLEKLQMQQQFYERAYGGQENTYMDGKLDDLMYRMGNRILTQMKSYHKELKKQQGEPPVLEDKRQEVFEEISEPEAGSGFYEEGMKELHESPNTTEELYESTDEPGDELPLNGEQYYINWKDGYSDAMKLIYKYKEPEKAFRKLEQLAGKGNVLAICEMGNMYHFGRGTEADEETAQACYEKALEGFTMLKEDNLRYCSYRIGKQHLYGQGTPQNYESAAEFLQAAAEKNHSYAQYLMGNLYLQGNGVERDTDTALRYYKASAKQRNPYAQYKLGQIYEQGENTEADSKRSHAYYAKALESFLQIESKDDFTCYRIGIMHLTGKGTESDAEKAVEYLSIAAEKGNHMAMYRLGKIYIETTGNPDLYNQGVRYLYQAALAENPYAQYEMGWLASRANDKDGAKKWFAASAAQGNEYAAKALYDLNKTYSANRRETGYYRADTNLRSAMRWLRQSLEDTVENWLNQKDYEKLQREIAGERSLEAE